MADDQIYVAAPQLFRRTVKTHLRFDRRLPNPRRSAANRSLDTIGRMNATL